MSNDATPPPYRKLPLFPFLFLIAIIYILSTTLHEKPGTEIIPYSQFMTYLSEKKISEVMVGQSSIEGQFKEPLSGQSKTFSTVRIDDPNLIQRLTTADVKFTGERESRGIWGSLFVWLISLVFMLSLWSFFLRGVGGPTRGPGFLSLGKSKAKIYVETDLKTRFEDVAGVDEAKEELGEVVNFLKEPLRFSVLGGRMPKGILLVGPPGTGKTLLARAVAGEAGVPFFSINGSEFVEMFVGLGAARVRDLFEQARSHAPCIVFIDELDALGRARGISAITGGTHEEKEQTLNQLLAEMDGFDPSKGVVILAATNRPEILDPALLRAGRFDRSLVIDKPDRNGRVQILKVHLKILKLAPTVDSNIIASMTTGFSGADLANLCNEAALIATRRKAPAVDPKDFTQSIERIVAGLERKSRLLNPNEKKRVAYHEMGHAIVAFALGHGEVIHKVSIIPRGISALGYTMSRPTEDRYLMEKNELESKIAIALGGRASEMLFFSDISTGAGDDLDRATDIARAMVTQYGMSSNLGLGVFEKEPAPMLGSHAPVRSFEFSQKTAELIDNEVRRFLDQALKTANQVILHYQGLVIEAATLLLEKETLDESALKSLWDKYQQSPSKKVA